MANDHRVLTAAFADVGEPLDVADAKRMWEAEAAYCEPLLRRLGARHIDSVDASGYEGSTIVHDLNQPLPNRLRGQYSTVLDAGTLEHVFNFPSALRSALESVRVGGHYIAFTPANNLFGHGFYQISPELYFRVLSPQNGFRVRCVMMRGFNWRASWYQVADPAVMRHRVITLSTWPVDLYVLAERIAETDILAVPPQQSDYVARWGQSRDGGEEGHGRSRLRRLAARVEPLPLKSARFTALTAVVRRSRGFRRIRSSELASCLSGSGAQVSAADLSPGNAGT